jgi:predicted ferric reductase
MIDRPPTRPARSARLVEYRDGNRLFLILLFWSAFAASVALWWFNSPAGSITGPAEALTATGRITGMIGGYVLLIQVLLASRIAWLEQTIGANDLLRWHRHLGGYLLVVILVHVAALIVGYNWGEPTSLFGQTWRMLTTLEDMVSAFVATGVLVGVCLLAIRAIRRRLPYELWQLVHRSSYLVLLLGYGHQFALGADLQSGFATSFWFGLYAFVVACLVWGRLIEPAWLNARHRLRVVAVVAESNSMFSIYVSGRRLERLGAAAGQFFRWRFLAQGCWYQSHPFSLSAAPNERWLRLTVNPVGEYTERLRRLRPGTPVLVTGPAGTFTADRRTRRRALLIAGGSGIAPIRALLDEMPPGTHVIYRASNAEELAFRAELDALANDRGIEVSYVVGSRHDPVPRWVFTATGMRHLVPDVSRRDVYLCGPRGLIGQVLGMLRRLRVPKRQIHLDPFEF